MKQHPLYYILASMAGVLLGAALLDLISGSWNEASLWQAAALGFLAVIAALSIDLFRRVCRFYPLLPCCTRTSNSHRNSQRSIQ